MALIECAVTARVRMRVGTRANESEADLVSDNGDATGEKERKGDGNSTGMWGSERRMNPVAKTAGFTANLEPLYTFNRGHLVAHPIRFMDHALTIGWQ